VTVVYFTDRDLGSQFPKILQDAGLTVERHRDHFAPDASDEEWLAFVGNKSWIALTHNSRIRYTPNEKQAVLSHGVRLLVIIGRAPYPELAKSFVATHSRIEAFLQKHEPPFIAKVYRASPAELAENPTAPGHIALWI
jgi:PIN like domain